MRMFFSQETKILQSMPKVDCSIARTEPTGVPLSATPPMGQSDRYERFFYPVCFHSDMYLLNPCPYSGIFFRRGIGYRSYARGLKQEGRTHQDPASPASSRVRSRRAATPSYMTHCRR